MNNIIELKNINKIYGSEIKNQVLYDINLAFQEGSFNSIQDLLLGLPVITSLPVAIST